MAGSGVSSLERVPPEILLAVFKSCESFEQLSALMSTCRYMHSIWTQNHPVIIWHVAPKFIPAFDCGLMAARATAIVYGKLRQGVLPPEIQPEDLTGDIRKPTLGELQHVVDLHHLLCRLESFEDEFHRYYGPFFPHRHFKPWEHIVQNPPPRPSDESEGTDAQDPKNRREYFHSAAYTSLLLGAVFARAYNLPFLDGTSLSAKMKLCCAPWYGFKQLERPDVEHLIHEYPAYDLMGTLTRHDQLFGPVLNWFVRSSLQEHKDNVSGPSADLASYLAFRNKPQSLFDISPQSYIWPWDKSLSSKYTGDSQEEGDVIFAAVMRAIEMFDLLLHAFEAAPANYEPEETKAKGRKTETVSIVRFAKFEAEEVSPAPAELSQFWNLPRGQMIADSLSQVPNIDSAWDYLMGENDHYFPPNYIDMNNAERAVPSPPVQLFAFLLKRDFNLQLVRKPADPNDHYYWEHIPSH